MTEALRTLAICGLVSAFVYVASIVIRNKRAYRFFAIHSPKLPVVPNPGWFGGHSIELFCGKGNWININRYHKELGPTYGAFMREKPMVFTTDLDLIKRMILDDPDRNINRMKVECLSDELESDNLVMTHDDQWRRIRKCIAPAFT